MGKKIALIILDALRYDYVSCCGLTNNEIITPVIDELAKDSEIYENAYSVSVDSAISLPKFFTGNSKEPRVGFKKGTFVEKLAWKIGEIFPPKIRKKLIFFKRFINKDKQQEIKETLIDKINLKKCCIVNSPYYSFGLEKGFDEVQRIYLREDWLNPQIIVDEAFNFLERNSDNFFLLCHFMQPHAPYIAPFSKEKFSEKDMRELHEQIKNGKKLSDDEKKRIKVAYKDNVKWIDSIIEPLIKKLQEINTEILVMSDHGELLGEYNEVEHPVDFKPCEELCHVPLIWFKPNNQEKGKKIKNKLYFHEILPKIIGELKG